MRRLILAAGILVAATAAQASIPPRQSARLADAARVVQDVRDSIPAESWNRAHCVAAMANLNKPPFIGGAEHGGVISCRAGDGWSAPMFVQLAKGSWRSQAGAGNIDAVLLVMNEQGVQKLLQGRITLGAETVSYARANGFFAGIDLAGGVLRPDAEANTAIYGSRATPRTILATRAISAPTEAHAFLSALNAHGMAATTAGAAGTTPSPASRTGSSVRSATVPTTDDDLRARVVDIQQLVDRILADTTPSAVGTAGSTEPRPNTATATVDRARLLQIREQLDALLAGLNRR
jgi:lipid-binding SYLF domain-containing protein